MALLLLSVGGGLAWLKKMVGAEQRKKVLVSENIFTVERRSLFLSGRVVGNSCLVLNSVFFWHGSRSARVMIMVWSFVFKIYLEVVYPELCFFLAWLEVWFFSWRFFFLLEVRFFFSLHFFFSWSCVALV